MSDLKWYVVRAVSGQERKVKSYLDNEIARNGMEATITQVLIPSEKVYEMRNGKKRVRERNFFPGYILIEANLVGEVPHILKNVTNVLGFLGSTKGGVPVPMRQSEINRILGKVDDMALTEEPVSYTHLTLQTNREV